MPLADCAQRSTPSTSKPKASTSKPASASKPASKPKPPTVREEQSSSSEDDGPRTKSKGKGKSKASAKRVVESSDEESEPERKPPKKKPRPTPPSSKAKKRAAEPDSSSSEAEAPPKPPSKKVKAEDGAAKPKYIPPVKTGPANPGALALIETRADLAGSKEIPEGEPDCLGGLAFVFTGELDSLSREEAQDLVKRYGGRYTTAPSGKTNYVVLGRDAGPSKLEKIKKLNLKTLDEDGLLNLIRTRGAGEVDAKVLEKRAEEAKAIKKASKELAKTAKPCVRSSFGLR